MLTLFHAPWSRSSRLVWLVEELGAEASLDALVRLALKKASR